MPAQAPYVPAPHLIATSHLSAAQLRDYFEGQSFVLDSLSLAY